MIQYPQFKGIHLELQLFLPMDPPLPCLLQGVPVNTVCLASQDLIREIEIKGFLRGMSEVFEATAANTQGL